jgi:hypothetical protein
MLKLDQPTGIRILRVIAFDQNERGTGGIGIVFSGEPPGQCLIAQIYDGDKLIISAYAAFFYLADMHYFTRIVLNCLTLFDAGCNKPKPDLLPCRF